MLSSNATIPVSSASSEDRRSRADIAASFQVTSVYLVILHVSLIKYCIFKVPTLFLQFLVPCVESCSVTSRGKVRTSN